MLDGSIRVILTAMQILPRVQAAAYLSERTGLPITKSTLDYYAYTKSGPNYRLFGAGRGRHAVYLPADLDAWIETRMGEVATVVVE